MTSPVKFLDRSLPVQTYAKCSIPKHQESGRGKAPHKTREGIGEGLRCLNRIINAQPNIKIILRKSYCINNLVNTLFAYFQIAYHYEKASKQPGYMYYL